jgi:hypothetical protein
MALMLAFCRMILKITSIFSACERRVKIIQIKLGVKAMLSDLPKIECLFLGKTFSVNNDDALFSGSNGGVLFFDNNVSCGYNLNDYSHRREECTHP